MNRNRIVSRTLPIVLLLTFAFADHALADGPAQPGAPLNVGPGAASPSADLELPAPTWGTRDWVMASLYGTLAGGGAGFALGAAGYQVDGHCFESREDCVPVVTAMGAYSGIILGSSSAVALYGGSRGFNGSFRAALLGAVIGNVGSGLPIVLAASILGDELGPPVALVSIAAFPAIGAAIAYRISHGINTPETPASGGLVDIQAGRARLSVPALSITPKDGGVSVYAPIVAGSF